MMHADINGFANGAGRFGDTGGLWMVSTREPCVRRTGAAMPVGVSTIRYGLEVPADAGRGRVSPPTSPYATNSVGINGMKKRLALDGNVVVPLLHHDHALTVCRRGARPGGEPPFRSAAWDCTSARASGLSQQTTERS